MMKRFYTLVSTRQTSAGHEILLDAKPVKTKSGKLLCAPNEIIAQMIVQEWAAQGEKVKPDTMPLTQILNTRIDRVARERAVMTQALLKYLDTDLLCYRADLPQALVERQFSLWQVWVDWFNRTFNTTMKTTCGLHALRQPQSAHDAAARRVAAMDDDHFTVFQIVTALSGSLILGLAFVAGEASDEHIMLAMYTEEDFKETLYNAEKHGADPLLQKSKNAARSDLSACARYLAAL